MTFNLTIIGGHKTDAGDENEENQARHSAVGLFLLCRWSGFVWVRFKDLELPLFCNLL